MTQAELDLIKEFTFIAGKGDYNAKQACIMSAAVAKWRVEHGEPLGSATDCLDCVCPVVRRLAISINDRSWWKDDAERTDVLLPFVDKILDTKNEKLTLRRAFLCADYACRIFAPNALEVVKKAEWADRLRALAPVVDIDSAKIAQALCREARAAAAADADAYAAYAAAAAAAAADAYAYADADADAAYAAYAAYADAYAAAAYADAYAKKSNRETCLKLLIELCEMK